MRFLRRRSKLPGRPTRWPLAPLESPRRRGPPEAEKEPELTDPWSRVLQVLFFVGLHLNVALLLLFGMEGSRWVGFDSPISVTVYGCGAMLGLRSRTFAAARRRSQFAPIPPRILELYWTFLELACLTLVLLVWGLEFVRWQDPARAVRLPLTVTLIVPLGILYGIALPYLLSFFLRLCMWLVAGLRRLVSWRA